MAREESMKSRHVFCLVCWAIFGGYYFGFQNGINHETSMEQIHLGNTHTISKNRQIEQQGEVMSKTTTGTKAKKSTSKNSKTPAVQVTKLSNQSYLVRPTAKTSDIQSMSVTVRFRQRAS
jgi:hypothetical protein